MAVDAQDAQSVPGVVRPRRGGPGAGRSTPTRTGQGQCGHRQFAERRHWQVAVRRRETDVRVLGPGAEVPDALARFGTDATDQSEIAGRLTSRTGATSR
jgi:hypothetical protein